MGILLATSAIVSASTVAFAVESNYCKLRDIASLVSESSKPFNVTWDEGKKAINLLSNEDYARTGNELAMGDGMAKQATLNTADIFLDGEKMPLMAYTIGDNNYVKLRDLCKTFDIGLTWNGEANTIELDTNMPYVADAIMVSTEYFTLELPATWAGKYVVTNYSSVDISFYDKTSYNDGMGGYLFSIDWQKEFFPHDNNYYFLGSLNTPEGTFYLGVGGPTDVQYAYEGISSKEAADNYYSMVEDQDAIIDTLTPVAGCTFTKSIDLPLMQ